jgi:hypothetical protein
MSQIMDLASMSKGERLEGMEIREEKYLKGRKRGI